MNSAYKDNINNKITITKDSKMFLELREIVNRYDPVSLVDGGAPADEHDHLTTEILALLFLQNSSAQVRDLLIHCYMWYGFDPKDIKEEFRDEFNKKVDRTYNEILDWYGVK